MKKITTLFTVLLFSLTINAQIDLEGLLPGPTFQDADVGAIAFGDIDNDGDNDLIATGKGGPIKTTLYTNDGVGNFTEVTGTPFVNVFNSAVGFEDFNNDGFLDLLITGSTSSPIGTANLYMNNGAGNFTLATGTPFEANSGGDFAFADVDADGDQDVVMTGYDVADVGFTTLYLNNGSAVFSTAAATPFEALKNSSVAFIDIENDNDEDLLIAGLDNNDLHFTALYKNDGTGVFTLVSNTPFVNCSGGDIAVGDSDDDGDLDILISGTTTNTGTISNLYLNDGSGSFSLASGTPFPGTQIGTTDFADFDNDGDLDVLIIGAGDGGVVSNIYENKSANSFVLGDELVAAYLASSAIGDINGDGEIDVIIAGTSFSSPTRATKTYINVSSALPVELVSFTAKNNGQEEVVLNWETATEINSSHFSVERSRDGLGFEEIEKVNAAGDSEAFAFYQTEDNNALTGRSYYRLKMVDKDETFSFSEVRTIDLKEESEVEVYPNPVVSNANIYVNGLDQGTFYLKIYDAVGSLIFQKNINAEGVSTALEVRLPELSAGLYAYSVYTKMEVIKSGRLLVHVAK